MSKIDSTGVDFSSMKVMSLDILTNVVEYVSVQVITCKDGALCLMKLKTKL